MKTLHERIDCGELRPGDEMEVTIVGAKLELASGLWCFDRNREVASVAVFTAAGVVEFHRMGKPDAEPMFSVLVDEFLRIGHLPNEEMAAYANMTWERASDHVQQTGASAPKG